MPNSYKGPNRRIHSSDHDTLVEIVQIIKSKVESDSENWKRFDNHVIEDKTAFDKISEKLWLHAKYIYMSMGAIAVIEIIFGLHK